MFHQLFEGLSLGIRIASLPTSQDDGFKRLPFLQRTLSMLFAVTTPIGIVIGLLSFTKATDGGTCPNRLFHLPSFPGLLITFFSFDISTHEAYTRGDVSPLSWHVDIRRMCRDACRGLHHGSSVVAEQFLETGLGIGEFICWGGGNGCDRLNSRSVHNVIVCTVESPA